MFKCNYGTFEPDGGSKGGEIVFTEIPAQLLESNTITAEYLRNDCLE